MSQVSVVVHEEADGNYFAECLELPDYIGEGETAEAALEAIKKQLDKAVKKVGHQGLQFHHVTIHKVSI